MHKLLALSGVAALGFAAQAAQAYEAVAELTFSWGGHTFEGPSVDVGWTSSGDNTIASTVTSNSTYVTTLGGYNSRTYYNSDFVASAAACAAAIPATGTPSGTRKYGCRFNSYGGTPLFIGLPDPATDIGPRAAATGSLVVTDTTLTGTLVIISTTDEPTGATTTVISGVNVGLGVGNGFDGYNMRSADGSPFGNVWYGVKALSTNTLTVNLTGTFTPTAWTIDGGTVEHTYGDFACQQGGFGGADGRGTLCSQSTTGGGFQADGGHLDWGIDPNGSTAGGPTMIEVRDSGGATTLGVLSGVLSSLTLALTSGTVGEIGSVYSINTEGQTGEFRRGSGSASGGCFDHIRFDGTKIACGTLAAGQLVISGDVAIIPLPAAAWLIAPAVLAAGRFTRRRKSA